MRPRVKLKAAAVAALLALAGCAPVAPPGTQVGAAAGAAPATAPAQAGAGAYLLPADSAAWYRQAARDGVQLLRIDPAASLIVVTVRRGGPLARLGHDHVVASHQVDGLVAPGRGRADFGFRLDRLAVDEAGLRQQARLDTTPSADAIAGTRHNMLTRVLEADRYPLVALRVQGAPQSAGSLGKATQTVQLSVTLHGVSRSYPAPLSLAPNGSGLVASGTLALRQSDFGITPMSILHGAMTVADTMELRYRIVAMP